MIAVIGLLQRARLFGPEAEKLLDEFRHPHIDLRKKTARCAG